MKLELPSLFLENMEALLGPEMGGYLESLEAKRTYGLRVNTSKISPEKLRERVPWKLEPIPWISNGFYYPGETCQPAKHPYYGAGLYYLQEPSAMTPASRLPVEPGDRVLDLCAAPGGKATELASRLEGRGLLLANDISASRAKGLLKNLELAGAGNILVTCEDPGRLQDYFPAFFQKILIDAPCSGEGMFRKEPRAVKAWLEHGPDYFVKIQRRLIRQGAAMLAPGGMLLYSTCTFNQQENEGILEEFLDENPGFRLCSLLPYSGFAPGIPRDKDHPELRRACRIFPHRMAGEGHFLALLQKEGEPGQGRAGIPSKERGGRSLPQASEMRAFFQEVRWKPEPSLLEQRGEQLFLVPPDLPDLRGLRILRKGLLLGEEKKNRFEPSQALAMHLGSHEYAHTLRFSLQDPRLLRYLKGETLEVSDLVGETAKGWQLVCVEDFPLGWGKLDRGNLKNKYLPGWRWQ